MYIEPWLFSFFFVFTKYICSKLWSVVFILHTNPGASPLAKLYSKWVTSVIFFHMTPLRWRQNGRDSVSNHQSHDCLLNILFRRRSKKTSKLRVIGFCAGNSPGTGEFPAQMASTVENVSIWWRHHVFWGLPLRSILSQANQLMTAVLHLYSITTNMHTPWQQYCWDLKKHRWFIL